MNRFTVLASFLQSIMGRGAENGVDSKNAYSASLLNQGGFKLDLHSWNVYDLTEGWQVYGELEI